MMYGTDGIMPGAASTDDQEAELRYQIRRQAHHPAIVGWWPFLLSLLCNRLSFKEESIQSTGAMLM